MNVKPLLRGHIHQSAFFCSLGACYMLMMKASSVHVFLPALIYTLSLVGMFGISALYHRPQWSPDAKRAMKRLDHSAIFVLIAGTATPIFAIAMPPENGVKLLSFIWMLAAAGIAKCVIWVDSPKWVQTILYVGVGWFAGHNLGAIQVALGPGGFNTLLAGGVAYSIGGLIYGLRWPDPYPKHFGHHEIFHLLTIVGAALHFIAIQPLIR